MPCASMSPPIRTTQRRPVSSTKKFVFVMPPLSGMGSTRPRQMGNPAARASALSFPAVNVIPTQSDRLFHGSDSDRPKGRPPNFCYGGPRAMMDATFATGMRGMNGQAFVIAPEVRDALAAGRPIVALESTIITHGMPYPENLATARSVEGVV